MRKLFRKYKKISKAARKRIINALGYSLDGFASAYKSEAALRQDLLIFLLGTILAFQLNISPIEKVILVFSLFLIVLMELVNTALEVIIDRISKEWHPLSKKAKDIGSLLVMLSFANMLFIWYMILQ